ncbi:hypothetical protein ACM66B_005825 [Microbotryomycetes sp. NB124-2]
MSQPPNQFAPLPLGSPTMPSSSQSLPASPQSPASNGNNSNSRRGLVSSASSPLGRGSHLVPPHSSGGAQTESASSSSSEGHYTSRSLAGAQQYPSQSSGLQPPSRSSSAQAVSRQSQLDATTLGVLAGAVGGSFGPFPRSSTYSTNAGGLGAFSRRDSMASSDVAIDLSSNPNAGGGSQQEHAYLPTQGYRYSAASYSDNELARYSDSPKMTGTGVFVEPNASLLWTKENVEDDDYLHNMDPAVEKMLDKEYSHGSIRGIINVGAVSIVVIVLVGLFAGWPIYNYAINGGFPNDAGAMTDMGWGLGGINATGQVPKIQGMPDLIDIHTPQSARTRTGFDGETYNLVFSDEFEVDGRTFWPGDDPFWEAVDLHYWGTVDLQWYDPDAITTKDGKLEITMSQEPIHDLNFRSGMLQSWNKLCFQGGYIEVSMSMPGTSKAMGYWPGAWTLGNLGRPGYGGTNHGTWPYTYDACDVGTMPNQTWPNGTDPVAAKQSGDPDYGGELSWLPGQRLSACTCPGEDHPGPSNNVGRGAPEIDINEMQVDYRGTGSTSQSIQFAPIDAGYAWKNETPETVMFNETITFQNIWHGSVNQESASVITLTDDTSYDGKGYTTFGFEYDPGADGRITWAVNATPSWQLNSDAIGPNAEAQISQRLISEEPMAMILNLAISTKFQPPEWGKIRFPGVLRFDYVRIYQKGKPKLSCDPPDHPTTDYINRHLDVYNNPNITMWTAENNQTWPKNRLMPGGCS